MRRWGIRAVLALTGATLLSSCQGAIVGSLTLDPNGGTLFYVDSTGAKVALDPSDPIFDPNKAAFTLTAPANEELPEKIQTAQAEKAGYGFAGWGPLVNGTVTSGILQSLRGAKTPYSPTTYQAVFKKGVNLTFLAVDEAGNALDGFDPVVFSTYEDQRLNFQNIQDVLSAFNAKAQTLRPYRGQGEFDSVVEKDAGGNLVDSPLVNIKAGTEDAVYYSVFSLFPYFTLHYGNGEPDLARRVKPGSALIDYATSDPYKEEAIFKGWYTDSAFASQFVFDSHAVMPNQNLDVYAKFADLVPMAFAWDKDTPSIPMTDYFKANANGEGQVMVEEETSLNPALWPETQNLDHDGKTFLFWYGDLNGNGTFDSDDISFEDKATVLPLTLKETLKGQPLTLRPVFKGQHRVYLDLTDASFLTPPSAFDEIGEATGIYKSYLDLGADLSGLLDPFLFANEDPSKILEGFAYYRFPDDAFEGKEDDLVRHYDSDEQYRLPDGLLTMPDSSLIAKPILSDRLAFYLLGHADTVFYFNVGEAFAMPSDLTKAIQDALGMDPFGGKVPTGYRIVDARNRAKELSFPWLVQSDEADGMSFVASGLELFPTYDGIE